jgi:multidrug efflux pump subunit AcrA (membrane-fusion protein)
MMRRLLLGVLLALAGLGLAWEFWHPAGPKASAVGSLAPQGSRSTTRPVEGQPALALDSATIRRIGIVTSILRSTQEPARLTLTGELVPDPGAIATVRAPVAGRLAVRSGMHWPAFGDEVTAGSLVGQVSDALPLAVPRGGVVSQVLAQPGEMVQPGQVLLEITDYQHPMARIAWVAGAPLPPPQTIELAPLESPDHGTEAHLVGAAPAVDPLTKMPAYLFRAAAPWAGARPGAPVVGLVPEPQVRWRGVFVPDEAVVQWDGLAWVFLQHGAGRYVRTPVSTERPVPRGWIEAGLLHPGDTVVARGAQQLLSEEFRAKIVVGEEVGE